MMPSLASQPPLKKLKLDVGSSGSDSPDGTRTTNGTPPGSGAKLAKQMALMPGDVLSSAEVLSDLRILDKIDKLFECNVGHMIDVPQIVVVGDQSSGKSSVLHGLKGLPFPRDSGLCTRFATQLIFRRSPNQEISVSVIPSATATDAHRNKLSAWKVTNVDNLDATTFTQIMNEVCSKHHPKDHVLIRQVYKLMGINDSGKTFSADVLKLELSGPELEHLSIVDVPGIFHATTAGITTEADKALVRQLVLGYMKNPRSVILMVIPSNVDIATQDILQMAKDVDPHSKRTLGILTKPDLVDPGAEHHVLDLLSGHAHQLTLGWHMVRNLGQRQIEEGRDDRHGVENDFFNDRARPWSSISKDQVGIKSLQGRLQNILYSHFKASFEDVRGDVQKHLKARMKHLSALGRSRSTTAEQSRYLMEKASQYQQILTHAQNTMYSSDDAFEKYQELSLFTTLIHRTEAFNDTVLAKGHLFEWDYTVGRNSGPNYRDPQVPSNVTDASCIRGTHPDLIDLLAEPHSLPWPETTDALSKDSSGIYKWLQSVYDSTRGFQIGSLQASILPNTMKKQSSRWDILAKGFVSDCIFFVHSFIDTAIKHVCGDDQVHNELMAMLLDGGLRDRYGYAMEQAHLILEIERNEPPMTQNHYYASNLVKIRTHRQEKAAQTQAKITNGASQTYGAADASSLSAGRSDVAAPTTTQTSESQLAQASSTVSRQTHHGLPSFGFGGNRDSINLAHVDEVCGANRFRLSNSEQAVVDIHDILRSYYICACKRFIDNVCQQAVGHHLLHGKKTPLQLFSEEWVSSLSEDQLATIAGEDSGTRRKRAQLQAEIAQLQKANAILR